MHWKRFSDNIPGLYPLDVSGHHHPIHINQICLQTLPNVPGGGEYVGGDVQNPPRMRSTVLG